MDTSNKTQPRSKTNNSGNRESNISDAASELLYEGKKFANELYEDGKNKVNEVEQDVKEYSDELLKKVQEHPLISVLIAGGIGFLLSSLLKK